MAGFVNLFILAHYQSPSKLEYWNWSLLPDTLLAAAAEWDVEWSRLRARGADTLMDSDGAAAASIVSPAVTVPTQGIFIQASFATITPAHSQTCMRCLMIFHYDVFGEDAYVHTTSTFLLLKAHLHLYILSSKTLFIIGHLYKFCRQTTNIPTNCTASSNIVKHHLHSSTHRILHRRIHTHTVAVESWTLAVKVLHVTWWRVCK